MIGQLEAPLQITKVVVPAGDAFVAVNEIGHLLLIPFVC